MLRACLAIKAVAEDVSQLRTDNVKVRVSLDSTGDQVAALIKEAFGLSSDCIYELTNDDELCALHGIVCSLCRWLQDRDPEAPIEFEGVVEDKKATVPLLMKVSNLPKSTMSGQTGSHTIVSPDSLNSSKRQRTHTEWQQESWEVRRLRNSSAQQCTDCG
jgi:hypothetical protein